MRAKVRKVLDTIKEMFEDLNSDEAMDLWAILTALRGPDYDLPPGLDYWEIKCETTGILRGHTLMLPNAGTLSLEGKLPSRKDVLGLASKRLPYLTVGVSWTDEEIAQTWPKTHFVSHVLRAIEAIEAKDPPSMKIIPYEKGMKIEPIYIVDDAEC